MTEAHAPRKSLEQHLVDEVVAELRGVRVGAAFEPHPAATLCAVMERSFPSLLRIEFSEWEGESLDGLFSDRSIRTDETELLLSGIAILITDQTVTPFRATIRLTSDADRIEHLSLRLG